MLVPSIDELEQGDIPIGHMLVIAECVIEWARAESQLRAVLTALEGRPLDTGATQYKRLSPDEAWRKIKKQLILRGATAEEIGRVQNNREASRSYYDTRKHLVHSGLVGWWRHDPSFLAFAPFESDEIGKMLFLWLPIEEIVRSTAFAKATGAMANKIMNALGD